MPVGPPMMSSAYHSRAQRSGDIARPYDGELRVANPGLVPQSGLAMEQVSEALVTQAPESTTGDQVFAIGPSDLTDHACPSTTMAHAGSLMTQVAVSHFSLSPLERESLGK
jgi:hypothetical protein